MHASSSGNASSTSTRLALGLLNFTTCAGLNHLPSRHSPFKQLCQVCKSQKMLPPRLVFLALVLKVRKAPLHALYPSQAPIRTPFYRSSLLLPLPEDLFRGALAYCFCVFICDSFLREIVRWRVVGEVQLSPIAKKDRKIFTLLWRWARGHRQAPFLVFSDKEAAGQP